VHWWHYFDDTKSSRCLIIHVVSLLNTRFNFSEPGMTNRCGLARKRLEIVFTKQKVFKCNWPTKDDIAFLTPKKIPRLKKWLQEIWYINGTKKSFWNWLVKREGEISFFICFFFENKRKSFFLSTPKWVRLCLEGVIKKSFVQSQPFVFFSFLSSICFYDMLKDLNWYWPQSWDNL